VRSSELVEDKGQPRCDGSCGAVDEYIGNPCLWTCERANEEKR
jgi:hypothetical protein